MCTDPATGKKTFTDKACPTKGSREEVKVNPTNFGDGTTNSKRGGTWSSDKDTRVSGRDNLTGHGRRVEDARAVGDTVAN